MMLPNLVGFGGLGDALCTGDGSGGSARGGTRSRGLASWIRRGV